jgi:hypothetical protein
MTTETINRTPVNRTGWPPGPWDGEPDRVEWKHEESGLHCLAKRHPWLGHWCGYVAVPPGHPWHGRAYGDDPVDVDVHGGLTYASECSDGICHVPPPGEPANVWWFGFDCAHCDDISPGSYKYGAHSFVGNTYRDLEFVQRQCGSLAEQLQGVK